MRPQNLIISGWGPYKEEVYIDFSEIGKDNVFLITGPTGSGKTTIFDAISFALYGMVSGENRGKDRLRSDYAKAETETYVKLTFTHMGQTFIVRRNPKYLRPKKSGAGETLQEEDAILYIGDNAPIVGKREVNPKIREILGITYEQFKQITMIAQGEFIKLIYANAEEKVNIFRNIFNTSIYRNLEKTLKHMSISLQKSREEKKHKILENITYIKAGENTELSEIIKDKNINFERLMLLLSEKIEGDRRLEKELIEGIALNDKKITSLISDKERAVTNNDLIGEYNSSCIRIEELENLKDEIEFKKENLEKGKSAKEVSIFENSYLDLNSQYENELNNQKITEESIEKAEEEFVNLSEDYNNKNVIEQRRTELNIQIDKLNTIYLPGFVSLEEILKNEKELILKNKKDEEVHNKLLIKLNNIKDKNEELNLKFINYYDIDEKLHKNEIAQIEQLKIFNDIKEIINDIENFYKNEEILKGYKESYIIKFSDFENKRNQYEQLDKLYKMAQAGILASDLVENHPCPVCGSTNHPNLAKLSKEVPTFEEVEKLKEIVEDSDKIANDEKILVQSQIRYNEGIFENIINKISKFDNLIIPSHINEEIEKTLMERLNNSSNVLDILKKEETVLNKNLKEKKTILIKIEENNLQLEEIGKEKELVDGNINLSTDELRKLETSKKMIKDTIPDEYTSVSQIKNNIKLYTKEFKELSAKIKKLENDYNKIKIKIVSEKERLKDTKKRILTIEKNVKTSKNQYEKVIIKYGFESEQDYKKYIFDDKQLKKLNQEVIKYNENLKSEKDRLAILLKKTKNLVLTDISILDEKIKEERNFKIKTDNELKRINNNIKFNNQSYKAIKDKFEEILAIESEYGIINDLSRIANGEGKDFPMDFEIYVLAVYFDEIIRAANIRFLKMTNNRFSLKRANDKLDGRKKSGLDLEVIDVNTGGMNPRSVKTLSGGESFMAALSLALGVSDVIQSYAGGIAIEALFIDEGFGSLDVEALDSAINTLLELSDHGNRMIGIISHVEELKERIDKQIIVMHDKTGSYIKY